MPGGGHLKMPGGGRLYEIFKKGGKTPFGELSVKAGIDNNPNPTQADRIAGATMEYGGKTMRHGGGMMEDGPMLVIKIGKDGMKYMQEGGKNPDEESESINPYKGTKNDPYETRAKGTIDNELINRDGTPFNSGIEGFNPKTLGEFTDRFFVRDMEDGVVNSAVKLDNGKLRPLSREEYKFMNQQFKNNDYGKTEEAGSPEFEKRAISFYLPEFDVMQEDESDSDRITSYEGRVPPQGVNFNRRFDKELDKSYDTEIFDIKAVKSASEREKIALGIDPNASNEEIQKDLMNFSQSNDPVKRGRRSDAHMLGRKAAAKTFFETEGKFQGFEGVKDRGTILRSNLLGDPTEKEEEMETSGAGMDTPGMQRVEVPDFSTPIPSSMRQDTGSTMNFGGRLRMANQGMKTARRTVFRFPRS